MTLLLHFNRAENFAHHKGIVARCGEDSVFDLVRILVDRGWWDEPAVFVDELGMRCMTVKSLHSCARRYRPNEADKAARKARVEARAIASITNSPIGTRS